MSVDFDNNTVKCDVNDPKDRKLASDFVDQNTDFSISAMDTNKGSSLMFENSEKITTYLSNQPTDGFSIALSFMPDNEEGLNVLGVEMFLLSELGDKSSPLIFLLSGTSTGIDFSQAFDNLKFDTTSDFGIGFIGLWGAPVNNISIGLQIAKIYGDGFVTAATEMAKFNTAFEKDPWGSFFNKSKSCGGPTRPW
jgi:hypothetical protein